MDGNNDDPVGVQSTNNMFGSTSLGALLTEEWMIQPYSPLPSFIEMIMIDDTSSSLRKAVQAIINSFHTYLIRTIRRQQQIHNERNNQTTTNQRRTSRRMLLFVIHSIRSWYYSRRVQMYKALERTINSKNSELLFIIMYMIERQCLQSTGSSARPAEIIYGARRVKLSTMNNVPNDDPKNSGTTRYKLLPLSSTDATRLALLVTLGPYLRAKLQKLFRRWKDEISTGLQEQRYTSSSPVDNQKFRHFFVMVYPFALASIDACNIWCKWRYLLGKSFCFDLSSLLLGQVVRRRVARDDDDQHQQSRYSTSNSDSTEQGSIKINDGNIKRQDTKGGHYDKTNKSSGMQSWQRPIIWFATSLAALSWLAQLRAEWLEYSRRRQQQVAQRMGQNQESELEDVTEWNIPPPPHQEQQDHTVDGNRCPLCSRPRIHPTASSSGHVFCLSCIKSFVKEHGTCPVTGIFCTESNLVRLYEPVS